MLRPDFERVAAFERERIRRTPPDHARNLRIFEALYHEAVALGALPLDDPLDGLDVDIRLAHIVNVRTAPR